MATCREQIEHLEANFKSDEKPWRKLSHSRKWLKRQMNKYMRRKNKIVEDNEGGKIGRAHV